MRNRFQKFIARLAGLDIGNDISMFHLGDDTYALNEKRIIDELDAHKNSEPVKAIKDLLENRMLQIWRELRRATEEKEVIRLWALNSCYEDIWQTIRSKCNVKAMITEEARFADKASSSEDELNRYLAGELPQIHDYDQIGG